MLLFKFHLNELGKKKSINRLGVSGFSQSIQFQPISQLYGWAGNFNEVKDAHIHQRFFYSPITQRGFSYAYLQPSSPFKFYLFCSHHIWLKIPLYILFQSLKAFPPIFLSIRIDGYR
jgi:hypothetical protein